MASYEQVIKFENEKPQGVIRLVEANGLFGARIGKSGSGADSWARGNEAVIVAGRGARPADFAGHSIEREALRAGNGAPIGVVWPWREHQQLAVGARAEIMTSGFEFRREAVFEEYDIVVAEAAPLHHASEVGTVHWGNSLLNNMRRGKAA